jgi:hypothetical protein
LEYIGAQAESGSMTGRFPSDMDSTPPPIPTSIYPARIYAAMRAAAERPEEHCRLIAMNAAVTGMPAII